MKSLETFYVSRAILEETRAALQDYGRRDCEGLVLWLGHINSDRTCRVEKLFVPPQDSIKGEDGVGYFVTSETLFSLNKLLSSSGLRLLSQVHSHPGWAYHSAADDRYCIVTSEGGFSIVVPDFGFGPADLAKWATYKLVNGQWKKLSGREVKSIFNVEEKQGEDMPRSGVFAKMRMLFS